MDYKIHTVIDTEEILIKKLNYTEISPNAFDLSILSSEDRKRYDTFISDKRRREFYFTRVLLSSFDVEINIFYRSTGKPLINEGHISISHSRNTIIVGFSSQHYIGIDIEFYNPKIFRVREKFLATYEKLHFDIENIKDLTLLWSIKEAIYKMEDIPGLLFKEHIIVKNLKGIGQVEVIKNGLEHNYNFEYIILDSYVITYCHLLC